MKKITLLIFIFLINLGFSQNLITNGDFANGSTGWILDGGGTVVNGEAYFATTGAAGNPWDTQLAQSGFAFTNATTYTLTFKARAASNRNITVAIQNPGPWTNQVPNQVYALTTTMQTFTQTVVASSTSANVNLAFLLANQSGSTAAVYIDDVVLSGPAAPSTGPTTNAPTPTHLQANVVSVFSDAYTTIATNYNPGWGQSGSVNSTFQAVSGSGNNILAYTNFNYQGTEVTATNLSTMEYLHVDVWTNANPAATILQVSPISNAGGASETLVTINHVAGQWYSVNIPKSAFTGMTWTNVVQMKFAANGANSTVPADIYLDNIYFWKSAVDPAADATLSDLKVDGNTIAGFSSGVQNYNVELATGTTTIPQITSATTTNTSATRVITQASALPGSATVVVTSANSAVNKTYTVNFTVTGPATAAPTPPQRPAGDVISLFSEAYTNVPITEWSTNWDDSSIQDVSVAGNAIKRINFLNFLGVQLQNYENASALTHFHMDYYIDAGTSLTGKVLNPKISNHAAMAGETNALLYTNLPTTAGSWVSLDVPLSSFTPQGPGTAFAREKFYQFLITSNIGTVYVDNIYLHKNTLSNDSFTKNTVSVYPNPVQDVLTINAQETLKSVEVFNINGQKMAVTLNNNTINVSSFSTGVYMLNVELSNGSKEVVKFVK